MKQRFLVFKFLEIKLPATYRLAPISPILSLASSFDVCKPMGLIKINEELFSSVVQWAAAEHIDPGSYVQTALFPHSIVTAK